MALSREEIHRLARIGAERRLSELEQESATILGAFPDLNGTRGRRAGRGAKQRRGRMSAAQRRAVSQRMKKYWAARRKAKG